MLTTPWIAPVGSPPAAAQVGQRVERAVEVARAVDQQQGLVDHAGDCAGRCIRLHAGLESSAHETRSSRSLACAVAAAGAVAQAADAVPPPPRQARSRRRAAAPADAPRRRDAGEPAVQHTVIEDGGARIDELRVRGQTQSITVTAEGRRRPCYEIIAGDGAREPSPTAASTSRGAAGKRVWNVLRF